MSARIAIGVLAALLLAAPVAHGRETAVKVTLTAPGHAPRIGQRWAYAVHATSGGKPVAARITAQIVDPIGGAHPVQLRHDDEADRRAGRSPASSATS